MRQNTAWYLGLRNEKQAFDISQLWTPEDESVGGAALSGLGQGAVGGALGGAALPLVIAALTGRGNAASIRELLPAMGVYGAGGALVGGPLGAAGGATSQGLSNLVHGRNVLTGE